MLRKYSLMLLVGVVFTGCTLISNAQKVIATIDTVKATSFLATIVPNAGDGAKSWVTGIYGDNRVSLEIFRQNKKEGFRFFFPEKSGVIATGAGVVAGKGKLSFLVDINESSSYKLMVSLASDSAGKFTLYSAYAFLPGSDKWKLIGSIKANGYFPAMERPAPFYSFPKKDTTRPQITDEWIQKPNGSWSRMDGIKMSAPVINLASHIDSINTVASDKKIIEKALFEGKIGPLLNEKGVFYQIEKEGTGKKVLATDSVKVFYKGTLFTDGSVFDKTTDVARTFPLSRLITGWQIGLPLIKEGGKIKLVIPSNLGYGIRTRSPKIPPNSILVFEIEVLEAKATI